MRNALPDGLYAHPFSKAYWRDAAREFKTTRMLVFAALMIALRVVCKPLRIQLGPMLSIPIAAMMVNALGAMSFGPVVAMAAAAVSDTLGCLLFPTGPYFFPYVFVEMAGSLIFSLFLYRTRVTVWRVLLARFCIDFFVNIALQTPITVLYYSMVLGKAYPGLVLLHVIKEVVMFPAETVLIAVFLRMAVPPLNTLGFVKSDIGELRFRPKTVAVLALLTAVGVGAILGYTAYTYNTTSLSASYTKWERTANNLVMREIAAAQDDALDAEDTVAVIEKAMPRFGSPEITYTVAVYTLDRDALAVRTDKEGKPTGETPMDVFGYSATPAKNAAKEGVLTFRYRLTVVTDGSPKPVSVERVPENQ